MSRIGYSIGKRALAVVEQLWLPLLLLAVWWFASSAGTNIYFPPLRRILEAIWSGITDGTLLSALAVSAKNLALGLLIACVSGIALGVVIGRWTGLRRVIRPLLDFVRTIPPAAIVPIIIIAFGIGASGKIALIAFGCFWPVLLNTIDGVRAIPEGALQISRSYRLPPVLRMVKVELPAASPQIMTGIRVAVSIGVILMVIGEIFGATEGIGYFINTAGRRFAIVDTWAGTLFIGLFGYLLSAVVLVLERRVLRWYFMSGSAT
jgi:ABC-type nitrate/sulfonate/bicarbonate transport system permease component